MMHLLIVTGYSRSLYRAGIVEFERRVRHGGWRTTTVELDEFLSSPPDTLDCDDIAIAGGDGTVRACLGVGPSKPLVIVPSGTGNDFARSLGIESIGDSAYCLCSGFRRRVDLGVIARDDEAPEYFVNGVGMGLDGVIAREAQDRLFSYNKAILRAIFRLPRIRFSARVTIDGAVEDRCEFLSLLAANGSYFGGGYRLSPHSRIDDGTLELIRIDPVTRLKYVRSLKSARTGAHLVDENVHEFRGSRILVDSPDPVPAHVDGEFREFRRAEISIRPKGIVFYGNF